MVRGDFVKVIKVADPSWSIEGEFLGSGDWGFRIGDYVFEDWEMLDYTFHVIKR